jgi:hypothetical protein
MADIEKQPELTRTPTPTTPTPTQSSQWKRITTTLATKADVELRGCIPVPAEDRTETNYLNIFTLWFSMSCNPLPCVHPTPPTTTPSFLTCTHAYIVLPSAWSARSPFPSVYATHLS